jgi:Na+-transporting methylmalonyl-CoA/oxaloacetate decarboxylase gamma subunit
MSAITESFSRHRVLYILGLAIVVILVAIPVTAYVIVPQFVRSTVNEAAPGSQSSSQAQGGAGAQSSASAQPGGGGAAGGTTTLATGQLQKINEADFGKGKVSIIQTGSQRFVRFENVEIAAAPAQRVYLSDQADGNRGKSIDIDLGALKATNGSFNYEIPSTVDLTRVKSVISWCAQFNTRITYASLQPV